MSSEVAVEMHGGRWKRYPEYKDSGVEWLREVPEGWGASKIIRYAYLKTGGTPDRKNMAYWENGTINWISSGEVNKKKIFETNNKITLDGLANSNAMILPINSIMVALNGQGKTKGTVAILKIESSCNQSLAAFICDEKKLHFNYLFYYLESKYKELRGLVGDNSRDGLSLGHLKSIYSPLPPIIKQRAIAAFLDRETGRIDTLIEKKGRQIKLLQEKRAALISHAVTKGLDPDVKMKDSGVEWLGELPEHWKTEPLKFNSYIKGRIGWQNLRSSEFTYEGPYLITGMHFSNGSVDWDSCFHITEERYDVAPEIVVKKHDILITKDGSIGKLAYIDYLPGDASLNSHLLLIRPLKNQYHPKYLYYLLDSSAFKSYIQHRFSSSVYIP